MKDKQLKLFKYTSIPELDGVAFPSEAEQIIINDFKYTATRMGTAPTITATINTPIRLSNKWDNKVYTIFDGEVFFTKGSPTRSIDEKSVTYKYNVEFVSKRVVLENTHFFDIEEVAGPQGQRAFHSHGCDFSFHGSIVDFCKKVNLCMEHYGFGYRLSVDDVSIPNYSRSLEFDGVTLYDAICSISDAFGLPFVFQKSEIIFTDCIGKYDWSLYYGEDNRGELGGLLSISRSVDRGDIITSITGYGSDKNIPYYYPNQTPKGTLKLGGTSAEKYAITNQILFSDAVDLEKPIYYKKGSPTKGSVWDVTRDTSETRYSGDFLYVEKENTHLVVTCTVTPNIQEPFYVSIIPIQMYYEVISNGYWWSPDIATVNAQFTDTFGETHSLTTHSRVTKADTNNNVFEGKYWFQASDEIYFDVSPVTITMDIYVGDMAEYQIGFKAKVIDSGGWRDTQNVHYYSYDDGVTATGAITIPDNGVGPFIINGTATINGTPYSLSDVATRVEFYSDNGTDRVVYKSKSGVLAVPMLDAGLYTTKIHFNTLDSTIKPKDIFVAPSILSQGVWCYENGDIIPNADIGVTIKNGYAQANNDNLVQSISYRINTQSNLRIPKYVDSLGYKELYYTTDDANAEYPNDTDLINPKQHIYRADEIFPTIEGMVNANGLRVDMFSAFAYDTDDNDEVYPEDYEVQDLAGKYKHPYFYAKLRKTDSSSSGFNLFDSAISRSPMTVTFNTGKCGGCSFTIGVDEETGTFNPVQVDLNGNLLRDANGDVIRRGRKQLRQNDTQNYEVWVALKKDDSTFGVLMPNAEGSMKPSSSDEFVITGIHLPDAYIRAAESRLEESMLKYMREYNDYKYAYNVGVSRIFYEQTSTSGFGQVNENYKVDIYDGGLKELYVKTFTYTMSSSSPLPEVSLTLCEDISPKVNTITSIKKDIHNTAANLRVSQVTLGEEFTRNIRQAKASSNSSVFKASALAAASLSNVKQDSLNRNSFKTINGESIFISDYGDTNIEITGGGGGGTNKEALDIYINEVKTSYDGSVAKWVQLYTPQDPASNHEQIVTGVNKNVGWSDIKTINGISILGSGDIKTSENLTIVTNDSDTMMSYILEADTIFVLTKAQTQGSAFMVRISDLEDENEHKWGVRFKVADNNTGSYSVTSDVSISWKDGRTFTTQNGGYYDVLLHYKDGVLYGEYSAYGDIATPTADDVYITDFTYEDLKDAIDEGIDVPCDMGALQEALRNNKIILIKSGSEEDSYHGVFVMNAYYEDLLYFSIVDNTGKVLVCDGTPLSYDYILSNSLLLKESGGGTTSESDVYIADFTLTDLQDTENDTTIDVDALMRAIRGRKVVLVGNVNGGGFCVMSNGDAQIGISTGAGSSSTRVTFTINNGTEVYSATAEAGSINAIKASSKIVKTLVTEDTIGDINTLLETIIAG